MVAVHLGPYRVVATLGSGAQGTVHLAEVEGDVEGLAPGTRVALKVLHDHLGSAETAVERFRREARALRSIRHPNVVRLLDAGHFEEGGRLRDYLATEIVEGMTLRQLLAEDGVQAEALCQYVGREAARGLEAIHRAGVVHRDVKPENVILTHDQQVKLMDLGVALLRDDVRVSRSGDFVGSILYAAPEQFSNAAGLLDGRADLYALGLVLYELLTGRHPFDAEGWSAVVSRHLTARPARPADLVPEVSPFFEALLLALLGKAPGDRPADAHAVVEALEAQEASSWWQAWQREHRARERRFRPLAPREVSLRGREAELDSLLAAWADSSNGHGRVVLVSGEAGIGKSRLVDELAERVCREARDVNFLQGRALGGGAATAAGAFRAAYLEFLGEVGLEETLARLLPGASALVAPFSDYLRGLPPREGHGALSADGLHTAFVRTLQGLAAERPTLLVIDDLHLAPEEGRALFAAFAQALAGHRVLMVATTRPSPASEWRAALGRLPHVEEMRLGRLREDAVGGLLEEALGSKNSAALLAPRLGPMTDGNPFFLLETIRAQREAGTLRRREDGGWTLQTQTEALTAPAVVRDLILHRLVDLEEGDRELLDLAAVCGHRFDPEILADVLQLPRLAVLRSLGRLARTKRLVVTEGRIYHFDHHLVRETLYGELSELLRDEYHAAIGEALGRRVEARAGEGDAGSLCYEACRHLVAGGRGAAALPHLDAALDWLDRQHAPQAAVELVDGILAGEGLVTGSRRVALLESHLRRLQRVGWLDQLEPGADALAALGRQLGDSHASMVAELTRGNAHLARGRMSDALAAAKRARELATTPEDRVQALGLSGSTHLRMGELTRARADYEEMLQLAVEARSGVLESHARSNLAQPLAAQGDLDGALREYRRSLALATAEGLLLEECVTAGNCGNQLRLAGRVSEAAPYLDRALELSRRIGYRGGEANALGNLAAAHYAKGRLAETLDFVDGAMTVVEELGATTKRLTLLELRGLAHCRLGRLESAREQLETVVRDWDELGVPAASLPARYFLAQLESDAGRLEEAARRFREGADLAKNAGDLQLASAFTGGLGLAFAMHGRPDDALPLLQKAVDGVEEGQIELLACLAALGGGPAPGVVDDPEDEEADLDIQERLTACFWMERATGDLRYLERAHALLQDLIEHAPEADRASMVERVALHREIEETWRKKRGDPTERKTGCRESSS